MDLLLVFFTGAERIPPIGFDADGSLNFNGGNIFPTASTCALTLTLPSRYKEYTSFKDKMLYALANHGGFGLC